MEFFLEHFADRFTELKIDSRLPAALTRLADRAAEAPHRVLCHRDFHSRNLMVTEDGSLAMVDIQDARWGPDSYDLASLLRDAYVDIPEHWIDPSDPALTSGRSPILAGPVRPFGTGSTWSRPSG